MLNLIQNGVHHKQYSFWKCARGKPENLKKSCPTQFNPVIMPFIVTKDHTSRESVKITDIIKTSSQTTFNHENIITNYFQFKLKRGFNIVVNKKNSANLIALQLLFPLLRFSPWKQSNSASDRNLILNNSKLNFVVLSSC